MAFDIQIATDENFSDIVESDSVEETTYQSGVLPYSTQHYWRVREDAGDWVTRNFTVQEDPAITEDDSQAGDEAWGTALYTATDGDNWYDRTGWETGAPVLAVGTIYDSPVGLEVADIDGELRITKIDFQKVTTDTFVLNGITYNNLSDGNNLTGSITNLPWANLQKCTYINLKQNYMTGDLPPDIFRITPLEKLSFGGQRGDLNLDDAQWNENTHLGETSGKGFEERNEFSGEIPSEIGLAQNLILFEARRQYLTGTIPPEIGSCTNLVGLFLNDMKGGPNRLGGALPTEIGSLVNLKHFHINGDTFPSNFSGEIPASVLNMRELRHIRIAYNNFTGSFPIFDTYDLRAMVAQGCNFTGEFPIEYFQGGNPLMSLFTISSEGFSGSVPDTMVPATYQGEPYPYNSMSKFGIGKNFSGPIPDWVLEMNDHKIINLSDDNNFTGQPLTIVMDRPLLKTLLLDNNSFSEQLPSKAWATSDLITLFLRGNDFFGSIPSEWSNLVNQNLVYIYLQDNRLSGLLPQWLGDIRNSSGSKLQRLYVRNNRFTYKDIIPHYDYIRNGVVNPNEYVVSPQKNFSPDDTILYTTGASISIDYTSHDYTNNQYQWYKNDEAISGETSPTLTVSGLGLEDSGSSYYLTITNPDLPILASVQSGVTTFLFDDSEQPE